MSAPLPTIHEIVEMALTLLERERGIRPPETEVRTMSEIVLLLARYVMSRAVDTKAAQTDAGLSELLGHVTEAHANRPLLAERDKLKAELGEARAKIVRQYDANVRDHADAATARGDAQRLQRKVDQLASDLAAVEIARDYATDRAIKAESALADFKRRLCEVIAEKG